jgi:hypothetical protein
MAAISGSNGSRRDRTYPFDDTKAIAGISSRTVRASFSLFSVVHLGKLSSLRKRLALLGALALCRHRAS